MIDARGDFALWELELEAARLDRWEAVERVAGIDLADRTEPNEPTERA